MSNVIPVSEHARTHYMPAITRELLARGYSKLHPPKGAKSEAFNPLANLHRDGKHKGGSRTAGQHKANAAGQRFLSLIPDNRLEEVLGKHMAANVLAQRERARHAAAEIVAGRVKHKAELAARAARKAAGVH